MGYQHSTVSTFYDKDGQMYTIQQRKKYHGGLKQSYKIKDYVIREGGPSGSVVGAVSKSAGAAGAKSWLVSNKGGGDVSSIMSESEYKDMQQTQEYTRDYEESLKRSEQKQIQAIEKSGKMQQTMSAQAGGQQLRTLQNALLQQGYTPEEAQQIASAGTESLQRHSAGIEQQVGAQKAGVSAQMAGMDIGKITSASDLENRLRQMTTQESQFAQQLALQKEQMKSSETGWGDVIGGIAGMGLGSMAGGIGQSAATSASSFLNLGRKGGEIKARGGEVDEKYRKGGYQSGFVEGMKMAKEKLKGEEKQKGGEVKPNIQYLKKG